MNSPDHSPGSSPPGEAASPRRWWIWLVLVLIAAGLIAAAWMLMRPDPRRNAPGAVSKAPPAGMRPATPAVQPEAAPGSPPAGGSAGMAALSGADGKEGTTGAAPEPGSPRHPIDRVLGAEAPADPATAALDVAASDKAILAALGALAKSEQLMRFMLPSDIVQRIVLTIDNLPADSMSMQYRAVVATPGSFLIERRDGEPAISPQNARRYEAFVGFASSLDARRLVAFYKRFYPLFQKSYRSIGYPDGHFNDRVVQVIDDLLSAPTPTGAIFLEQPRVLYEYAESSLERRSVGQRMMIRMGPEHSARLKNKLREIRALLTPAS